MGLLPKLCEYLSLKYGVNMGRNSPKSILLCAHFAILEITGNVDESRLRVVIDEHLKGSWQFLLFL